MSAPFGQEVQDIARSQPLAAAVAPAAVTQLEARVRADLETTVLPVLRAQGHARWLATATAQLATLQEPLRTDLRAQWLTDHDTVNRQEFAHYRALDRALGRPMIWRFTSSPSTEIVRITDAVRAPDDPTGIVEILTVIAAHSGGNDKSAPDVKTLSFARNPAMLIGTACSSGGDPHVQDIVERAAYLVGIDITTLAPFGVSAHPALGRAISMFETEYVLVSTPGTENTLAALATVIFPNPLKSVPGAVFAAARTPADARRRRAIIRAENTRIQALPTYQKVVIEAVPPARLRSMDPRAVAAIQQDSIASTTAAMSYAELIRSTMSSQGQQIDNFDYALMSSAVQKYIADMRRLGVAL